MCWYWTACHGLVAGSQVLGAHAAVSDARLSDTCSAKRVCILCIHSVSGT